MRLRCYLVLSHGPNPPKRRCLHLHTQSREANNMFVPVSAQHKSSLQTWHYGVVLVRYFHGQKKPSIRAYLENSM
jgi:hypothetical protein